MDENPYASPKTAAAHDPPRSTTHSAMRVVALLALIFGYPAQLLLDGQTFTHAVQGIVCGIVAIVCGLVAAHQDVAHRWEGRALAGLGLVLGILCLVTLPSAFSFQ